MGGREREETFIDRERESSERETEIHHMKLANHATFLLNLKLHNCIAVQFDGLSYELMKS